MSRTVTPPVAKPVAPSKPAHERIAMRAYEKWLQRGCQSGTDQQDWLEAEAELMAEMHRTTGAMPTTARPTTPQPVHATTRR